MRRPSSSRGWATFPKSSRDRMINGIVAFEIPIARIEGKFKLGQNRSRKIPRSNSTLFRLPEMRIAARSRSDARRGLRAAE